MKRFYLLTALFALTAAGCVKVDLVNIPPSPENLTVEQTDYMLGAFEERTATAVFTATADWTLSIVYDEPETGAGDETGAAGADAAWLTADVAGGAAGEQSVGMSAARNFQASPRTAYVDLLCGEQTVRLTVTQTGLSDDMDFSALFDETFAQKLQERDIVADAEKITMQEMQSMAVMTELDISETFSNPGSLTSLRGIEYFEALTSLNCNNNQLPMLDVSQNTKLTTLVCDFNSLTELDVSQNTKLTYLNCVRNSLTELDVRANTVLTELRCDGNQLTELDVRANTALTELWCQLNQLTELDVSQNTELMYLICNNNHLALLDVSQNTELKELGCPGNQLTELDVSKNTKLTRLSCGFNQLTELDVRANTALTELLCDDNQLPTLDVSANTALTELWCQNNSLTELDVSKNTKLTRLLCGSNSLTSLDVSQNTKLTRLLCTSNSLESLDVSQNTALMSLRCEGNPGDGNSVFPLTVWGDQAEKPGSLYVYQSGWWYNGKYITIQYQTAPGE